MLVLTTVAFTEARAFELESKPTPSLAAAAAAAAGDAVRWAKQIFADTKSTRDDPDWKKNATDKMAPQLLAKSRWDEGQSVERRLADTFVAGIPNTTSGV